MIKRSKRKAINPCALKGVYGGRGYSGRVYSGSQIRYSGCECNCPFFKLSDGTGSEKLHHALNPGCKKGEAETVLVQGALLPKKTLLSVPCNETFRYGDSEGTKLYRKAKGRQTRFQGCQSVEEELLNDKLVRHKPVGDLGMEMIFTEGLVKESPFEFPRSEYFLNNYADEAALAIELALDPEKQKTLEEPKIPSPHTPLSDLIRAAPLDFKHAIARNLYEEGHFDNANDPKLRVAAFFVARRISYRDRIEAIVPLFDYNEFLSYQSRIHREIERHLPERVKRFYLFWESLTLKQQEAVRIVYLKNDEQLSLSELAGRNQLSREALRDRLNGAIKKLTEVFFELTPITETRPSDYFRKLTAPPDRQMDGFYVRSSAKKVAPVYRLDPKNGRRIEINPSEFGPPRAKAIVNKSEVFKWIEWKCPPVKFN